uniref:Uncharacterized protein n=1 Tax=Populus alba TaxID=43335 RepID=A0A4U5QGW0_POPAL|nr:hypothetical protein D5086_0000089450 [Populus alba]
MSLDHYAGSRSVVVAILATDSPHFVVPPATLASPSHTLASPPQVPAQSPPSLDLYIDISRYSIPQQLQPINFDSPYVASGFTTTTSSTAVSSLCAGHDYVCSSYVGLISIFPGPIALLHGATIDSVNTLHIERMKYPRSPRKLALRARSL